MLALKIILGILLFLVLLLFLRVKISIISDGGNTKLLLRILGIPVKLYPAKEKKRKIRMSDYTPRGLRRAQKKKEKQALKESKKKKTQEPEKEKPALSDTVSVITALVRKIVSRFFRHLRIDVAKIYVSVGTPDAAKTALLYGVVCQGVAYLCEILDRITNVKKTKKTEVSVVSDFVSGKTRADINISFSLVVWQALDILLSAAFEFIKNKATKNKNHVKGTDKNG